MRPRAGRLQHKVNLQQQTTTRGSMGGSTRSWTTTATVRAGIEPISGKEFFQADQINSKTKVMIIIRYGSEWAAIDNTWRVVDANTSKKYDINSVINEREMNGKFTLMCSEGQTSDE